VHSFFRTSTLGVGSGDVEPVGHRKRRPSANTNMHCFSLVDPVCRKAGTQKTEVAATSRPAGFGLPALRSAALLPQPAAPAATTAATIAASAQAPPRDTWDRRAADPTNMRAPYHLVAMSDESHRSESGRVARRREAGRCRSSWAGRRFPRSRELYPTLQRARRISCQSKAPEMGSVSWVCTSWGSGSAQQGSNYGRAMRLGRPTSGKRRTLLRRAVPR
jgi:hypothetical protein